MPRRDSADLPSPRALARLRARDRPFVPTEDDLRWSTPERGPGADGREVDDEPGARGRHGGESLPRRWVRLPRAVVGARWQPRGAAVLGVVLVCALVAAVLGVRVAWARSAATGTVIAPGGGSRAGPAASALPAGEAPEGKRADAVGSVVAGGAGAGGDSSGATGTTPPGPAPGSGGAGAVIVVHVVGQVRSPGVLHLPAGSRVSDAVAAAGGATAKADVGGINLARPLVDGEQVRVPAPGEVVAGPPVPPAGGGGGGAGGSAPGAAPVSLNTADLAALDTLPGVGPVLAQRILDWRSEHGRFTTVDELSEVSGIGEKLLAGIRPLVSV